MTEAETGYKALAYIMQTGTIAVPLGTDKREKIDPTGWAACWQKAKAVTSITLPVDDNPVDIAEIGTRILQRMMGALGISGTIEKWKMDGEWWGAALGASSYSDGKTTYSKGDVFPEFKLRVYLGVSLAGRNAAMATYATSGELDTAMGPYDSRVEFIGVKFSSWSSTTEPNAPLKESLPYTAEDITVQVK